MKVDLYIKVGNDSKTRFWKDFWIEQFPLRNLFQICVSLDANVGDCWARTGMGFSLQKTCK